MKQQVEINLKYEGYIKRQLKQVEQFKKLEAKKNSGTTMDYEKVGKSSYRSKAETGRIPSNLYRTGISYFRRISCGYLCTAGLS